MQTNFADRMPDTWWFRVVPRWQEVDRAQFRRVHEVVEDFTGAGWRLVAREDVTWPRAASLAEDHERLRLRAVSFFAHLDEEAAAEGFARIETALSTVDDGPQDETNHLLVLERPR